MKVKNNSGFTLIEIVMTIVIAGVMLSSMLKIFTTPLSKGSQVDIFSTALHLASGKMEIVSNKSFSKITSEPFKSFGGTFIDFNSSVEVHYVTSTSPEVFVDPTATSYKWIRVTVTSSNGAVTGVKLITLVTDASN